MCTCLILEEVGVIKKITRDVEGINIKIVIFNFEMTEVVITHPELC